ncbi:helix-turn-helix transcriptional regulator [Indiicoccus explosivorum]|uniref:helix-turn-helix transcriptional regulator n=1 Tax=Indiicoccus explosivorum TaxID=1917864 RepID=UPI00138FF147|nr:AraC family transcriptional regulator [Indiicoccus explosivorum]
MKVAVLSHNTMEMEGLKWIAASHMNGVELVPGCEGPADCYVVDMDIWSEELERMLSGSPAPWIGIASDRTFQTAYRALQGHAENLLFRPFDPMAFVRQLQQIRFRLRNEASRGLKNVPAPITYPDLFSGSKPADGVTMAAFALGETEAVPALLDALLRYPFGRGTEVFALSDFVLLLYFSEDAELCLTECRAFASAWKERADAPLSVFVNGCRRETVKAYYQGTRELIGLIFYESFDLVSLEGRPPEWQTLDPFLSPIEQRVWIEMLQRRETAAMKQWLEEEFLTFSRPYPDPGMIRVRLTSVLAQVRRYMKTADLDPAEWDAPYRHVFSKVLREPVVYRIVQALSLFIADLLEAPEAHPESGKRFAEKVLQRIEANYWDTGWNLAACAEELQLNKSTLSRRFRERAGRKFQDVLLETRIREAKRLLRESRLPLEEVARLSGFSRASYFSSVFKKTEGRSPSDFRKEL